MGLNALLYVVSLLLGLIIGSFLNVVAYRVPKKESLIRPGSHCPSCGHAVRWHDNVPVLGWLALRGRCRDCQAAIPVRYPVVEGLTGLLFLAAALVIGWAPRLLLAWAFFAVLVAVSLIDLDYFIIPDKIVLPSAAVGLAASVLLAPQRWWQYLVSGLGAALFLFVVALIWPGGMGLAMSNWHCFWVSCWAPMSSLPCSLPFSWVASWGYFCWPQVGVPARTGFPLDPSWREGVSLAAWPGRTC